jgi:hypothetical protein
VPNGPPREHVRERPRDQHLGRSPPIRPELGEDLVRGRRGQPARLRLDEIRPRGLRASTRRRRPACPPWRGPACSCRRSRAAAERLRRRGPDPPRDVSPTQVDDPPSSWRTRKALTSDGRLVWPCRTVGAHHIDGSMLDAGVDNVVAMTSGTLAFVANECTVPAEFRRPTSSSAGRSTSSTPRAESGDQAALRGRRCARRAGAGGRQLPPRDQRDRGQVTLWMAIASSYRPEGRLAHGLQRERARPATPSSARSRQ